MLPFIIYGVGVLLGWILCGYLANNNSVDIDEEVVFLIGAGLLWPLVLAIGIIYGIIMYSILGLRRFLKFFLTIGMNSRNKVENLTNNKLYNECVKLSKEK